MVKIEAGNPILEVLSVPTFMARLQIDTFQSFPVALNHATAVLARGLIHGASSSHPVGRIRLDESPKPCV
ncbi:hypothetical protein GE061_004747 [Apolygus lucorum]|uniref:Uncharacterized protein n=1 Tax=Apolygus lucorum TaxID=248454 RepID=A0A8S9X1K4_APOLU|nr:hypothetical protein GE061_004747 [Apolygus lucorum]